MCFESMSVFGTGKYTPIFQNFFVFIFVFVFAYVYVYVFVFVFVFLWQIYTCQSVPLCARVLFQCMTAQTSCTGCGRGSYQLAHIWYLAFVFVFVDNIYFWTGLGAFKWTCDLALSQGVLRTL